MHKTNLDDLPRRIFLDSSVMQTLDKYGDFLWDGGSISKKDKIRNVTNGMKNLNALTSILLVNQRANFEFALSENSMDEVKEKGDSKYMQWAYDLLDHWMSFAESYEEGEMFTSKGHSELRKIDKQMFSYLSKKDARLIFDAVKLECDTFLTMEENMVKNSKHLKNNLNIKIIRPFEYWNILKPWAALWR